MSEIGYLIDYFDKIENNLSSCHVIDKNGNLVLNHKFKGVPSRDMISASDITIYNGNTSKIGIFTGDETIAIVRFYNNVRAVSRICEMVNDVINNKDENMIHLENPLSNISLEIKLTSSFCHKCQGDGYGIIKMLSEYRGSWVSYMKSSLLTSLRRSHFPFRKFRN